MCSSASAFSTSEGRSDDSGLYQLLARRAGRIHCWVIADRAGAARTRLFSGRRRYSYQRKVAELIESELRSCTHFVILLSARSVLSEFVLAELRRVRRRDDFGTIPIGVGFADSIPYEFATYLDTDSIAPDFHHSTGTELGRRDIGGNAGRICEQSVITRGAAGEFTTL